MTNESRLKSNPNWVHVFEGLTKIGYPNPQLPDDKAKKHKAVLWLSNPTNYANAKVCVLKYRNIGKESWRWFLNFHGLKEEVIYRVVEKPLKISEQSKKDIEACLNEYTHDLTSAKWHLEFLNQRVAEQKELLSMLKDRINNTKMMTYDHNQTPDHRVQPGSAPSAPGGQADQEGDPQDH